MKTRIKALDKWLDRWCWYYFSNRFGHSRIEGITVRKFVTALMGVTLVGVMLYQLPSIAKLCGITLGVLTTLIVIKGTWRWADNHITKRGAQNPLRTEILGTAAIFYLIMAIIIWALIDTSKERYERLRAHRRAAQLTCA